MTGDWLRGRSGLPNEIQDLEDVLDPELPIVDSHHHLWLLPKGRYLIDEFKADLESGHKISATVYVECSSMYRQSGPEAMRPVGEAEFAAGVAAMSNSGLFGPTKMCAAFVGRVDFRMGEAVDEVLDALAVASGERLRGIRGSANWDADPAMNTGTRAMAPKGLLNDEQYRAGVRRLAARKLVYDCVHYYPQITDLCSLADDISNTTSYPIIAGD